MTCIYIYAQGAIGMIISTSECGWVTSGIPTLPRKPAWVSGLTMRATENATWREASHIRYTSTVREKPCGLKNWDDVMHGRGPYYGSEDTYAW